MTTPTDAELLPCPFCGAPAHGYAIEPHSHSPSLMRLIPELPDHPGSYVIEGQCACGSGLIGENEAEVVARWNRRAPQTVAGVEPVAWFEYNESLDAWFLAYHYNPKAKTRPLVFGDAAPPPQAVREPIPQTEVVEAFCKLPHPVQFVGAFEQGVRFAEHRHGITKGGQHGTE